MIRHEDQRPIVRLEREADVGLGAAIWTHRRPFACWEHESAPELRTREGAARHANDHAGTLRPALNEVRRHQRRREGKEILDWHRMLHGRGWLRVGHQSLL